ncbi:MAG TPA: EAL domain-containing protein [Stellaceae bacterium]|nr:EAL domain-containing protein [Stellaceae bacterium]
MLRTWDCLSGEHDWRLVLLAATLCILASLTAIHLWWRAIAAQDTARRIWLAITGIMTGFCVWATHFIAMLAYTPGLPMTYDVVLTATSLIAAIVVIWCGLSYATHRQNNATVLTGGACVGFGIAVMHYMGIAALSVPGRLHWAPDLVATSIVVAIVFGAAALWVAARGRRTLNFLSAGILLACAVSSHHFIAMGAVDITADPTVVPTGMDISPKGMAVTVAAVAVGMLGLYISATAASARAQRGAQESERRFRILVEGVKEYAIYLLDPKGVVTNWNAGAERITGYVAEEIVGRHFSCFYTDEDLIAGDPDKMLSTALATGRCEVEGWRVRKDGTRFWAVVVAQPIHDENGILMGFAKITRDVSVHRANRIKLEQARNNLDRALANMSQGLCLFDANERLVLANRRFAEIVDVDPSRFQPGMSYFDILNVLAAERRAKGTLLQNPADTYRVHMARVRDGSRKPIIVTLSNGQTLAVTHSPVADGSWVMTCDDITARRLSEEKIAHMAQHDSLTGLPNRVYLAEYLQEAISKYQEDGRHVALLAIDLNRFKEINDQHGHAIGDKVLSTLAARMSGLLKPDELFARVGGDEFVGVKRYHERAEINEFLNRIEDNVFQPIRTDGAELPGSGSIGVAFYPRDAHNVEQLLNNADLAMYRAKASLTRKICFYEAEMDELARARRTLVTELWSALEREQFIVHYQVQKDMQTGLTTGYEALVRWQHPERGQIPPSDFIPVAEECGAILKLGEWVLRQACSDAAGWAEPWKVAVNLSAVQLSHLDLVGLIEDILIETRLPPERLELEITETSIIGDKKRALRILSQIKALGVSIAIDDFGTGYSSLDTLNSFPFDKIKIDRSFIMEAERRPQSKAIMRSILALGRSLAVPVLAEGIETESQLAMLIEEGCLEGQGYLFGKPMPSVVPSSQIPSSQAPSSQAPSSQECVTG